MRHSAAGGVKHLVGEGEGGGPGADMRHPAGGRVRPTHEHRVGRPRAIVALMPGPEISGSEPAKAVGLAEVWRVLAGARVALVAVKKHGVTGADRRGGPTEGAHGPSGAGQPVA